MTSSTTNPYLDNLMLCSEYRKRKVFWDRVIKMHDEYCKQRQDQWDRLSKLRQTLNICIPNSPSSFVKVYWKSVFDRLFFLLNVKAENFGTLGSLCRWILYPFLHKVPKENRVDRMHKEYHTRRQELRERVSEGDQD
ncbi:unnamed protein product [Arabis nemorensis]|uniref:Uncharacterized protein n=1 Tax=Arabis nemorensis TaxID=586526 RepID=A0A565B7X9_9BRAS|nr:unnamed protein product [Arabis nemorensis]